MSGSAVDAILRQLVREEFAVAVAQLNDPLRPASYTIADAARMLAVSTKTCLRFIQEGRLAAVQYEGMVERRVTRQAIDDFLARATPVEPQALRSVS